uniref:Uncharacterized protein n=1 Tax=Arundo donax TaxID=35708 RepID=A0A0A9EFW9_ARUDO
MIIDASFSLVLYKCLTAATRSAEGFDSSVNVCSIKVTRLSLPSGGL